jgi:eukaryotic-like serine/threonine-protein kinase
LWPKESFSDRVPEIGPGLSTPASIATSRRVKKPSPFGKYFLLERINVGGMAEVFRAKAFGVEGFERLVAVKRILPNIAEDKEFIRMFIDEAKLAVQLNHANIAQIFDLGVVDGSYYIALEHVHGRDLRAIFDRCRQLGEAMPVAQACFLVMKVCEGLDYAHNKRDQAGREINLVHRDVSPQNVLVSFEGEVKLIDFGIAKAAGKGSKTQAGILKGKFGYMSPEQVRGMPIDRRSDVFSCGIVLYELLTGERLFVGESDFSTLEKVRNVEILPPSTYNRKIPDELERIVLKALAKDVDDRYQNAIDLHDELQAFVYTAGEFYSRKDLAGQMKKTFGKEIEEETAKLESYRQLKPPSTETPPPVLRTAANGSKPPANTPPASASPPGGVAARKTIPPGAAKPPPPPSLGRMTGQHAVVAAVPGTAPSSPTLATKPVRKGRGDSDENLAWDDDELETQIYDDAPGGPQIPGAPAPMAARQHTPPRAVPVSPTTPPPAALAQTVPPSSSAPDLSSLVSTGRGWEPARSAANRMPPPPSTPPPSPNGTPPHLAAGKIASPLATTLPGPLDHDPGLLPASAAPVPTLPSSSPIVAQPSMPGLVAAPVPIAPALDLGSGPALFEPMPAFGASIVGQRAQRRTSPVAIALVAVAGVAVVVTLVVVLSSGKSQPPAVEPKAEAISGDQNTGFDLYVSPAGISQWKLDGQVRTDRLPSRIRGIGPGVHEVAIEAPPGFVAQDTHVTVEAGKSSKVEINLVALDITGEFDSTPPGATVSLIVDGKRQSLGVTPTKSKLDPHFAYQVLFEKAGYVSINRPLAFSGGTSESVVVNLEKAVDSTAAGSGSAQSSVPSPTASNNTTVATPAPPHPHTEVATPTPPHPEHTDTTPHVADHVDATPPTPRPTPHVETPRPADSGNDSAASPGVKASGTGTLALGSKPPCDIFVDGAPTGSHTPNKLPLAVGRHKITLVNNEFSIRESFTVEIKADQVNRELKDYSDRLPK